MSYHKTGLLNARVSRMRGPDGLHISYRWAAVKAFLAPRAIRNLDCHGDHGDDTTALCVLVCTRERIANW